MSGPLSPVLASLADAWLERAAEFRRYAAEAQAVTLERAAAELRAALDAAASEPLTLEQAADESGMSRDHLRHLVASGAVPNAGRKGAPRIRRADLPTKPGKAGRPAYSPDDDALRLVTPRRAG